VALQPLHVEQVLWATGGALVPDEIASRQDGHDLICERSKYPCSPSFFEGDAVDGRDHVDADGATPIWRVVPGDARSDSVRS
jgi:hypothetical protein